jgi:hypothetical protein
MTRTMMIRMMNFDCDFWVQFNLDDSYLVANTIISFKGLDITDWV